MGTASYQASFAGNPVLAGEAVPGPEETRQESRISGQFAGRTHGLGTLLTRCYSAGTFRSGAPQLLGCQASGVLA